MSEGMNPASIIISNAPNSSNSASALSVPSSSASVTNLASKLSAEELSRSREVEMHQHAREWAEYIECLSNPDPLVIHRALDHILSISQFTSRHARLLVKFKIVDRLIHLIDKNKIADHHIIERSLTLLGNISYECWLDSLNQDYLTTAFITPLFNLMDYPQPGVVAQALRCLWNLSYKNKTIHKHQIVFKLTGPLLHYVSHNFNKIKALAAGCIEALCQGQSQGNHILAQQIANSGGIDKLLSLLQKALIESDSDMQYCFLAAINSTMNEIITRKRFIAKNGIAILLRCLNSLRASIVNRAADITIHICFLSPPEQQAFLTAGGLKLLNQILQAPNTSELVHASLRCQLAVLSACFRNPLILEPQYSEELTPILIKLCEFLKNSDMGSMSIYPPALTLAALSNKNAAIQKILLEQDCLKYICDMLSPPAKISAADVPKVQSLGLFLIQTLAADSNEMQSAIHALGVTSKIIPLLKSDKLIMPSCRALAVLTHKNQEISRWLMNENTATGTLLKVLCNEQPHISIHSAGVFYSSCSGCGVSEMNNQLSRIADVVTQNKQLNLAVHNLTKFIKQEHDKRRQREQEKLEQSANPNKLSLPNNASNPNPTPLNNAR
jgi:hypothetical protein